MGLLNLLLHFYLSFLCILPNFFFEENFNLLTKRMIQKQPCTYLLLLRYYCNISVFIFDGGKGKRQKYRIKTGFSTKKISTNSKNLSLLFLTLSQVFEFEEFPDFLICFFLFLTLTPIACDDDCYLCFVVLHRAK